MKTYHSYGTNFRDLIFWLTYTHIISKIPYGFGNKMRYLILIRLFSYLGNKTTISTNVRLIYPQGIRLFNNVGITRNVELDGRGGIEIGNDTMIGFESIILTSTHVSNIRNIPIRQQGMFSAKVKIGEGVWIGTRVIILPGVLIGDGAIIGANSVVDKDIPPNTVFGGVPARFIKER